MIKKIPTTLLIVLGLVSNAILSLSSIGKWSVWHDEGYTAMLKDYPIKELLARTALDVHPPLYYILLKIWGDIFGNSIVTLRLFSLSAMLVALALTIFFVWRFFGERLARWSILPLIFGPFLIRYSQEMRMYALATVLVVASTWLFAELVINHPKKTAQPSLVAGYGISIALMLYTHYFAALILFVHLFVLLRKLHREAAEPFSLITSFRLLWHKARWATWSLVLALVLFAPWAPKFLVQFLKVGGGFWIPQVSPSSFFSTISSYLIFRPEWMEWHLDRYYVAIVFGAAWIIWVLAQKIGRSAKINRDLRTLLISSFTVPMVVLFGISLILASFYYDRYFIPFAPFFYAFLGIGLGVIWEETSSRRFAINALVFLVACYALGQYNVQFVGNNYGHRLDDYFTMKHLSAELIPDLQPGDIVLAENLGTYFDVRAYLVEAGKAEPKLLAPNPLGKYGNTSLVYNREDLLVHNLTTVSANRIWFVSGQPTDPVQIFRQSSWQDRGTVFSDGYAKITLLTKNQ